MKITHNITLDMLKPRYEVVNVKQGAELTQWIHADLVVGGSAWTPPSDAVVELRCKKPDRTCCLYSSETEGESNAFIISGSSVEVRLHTQMMTCAGKFPVDIAFKKDNEVLPLFSFILDVERQAATNGDMASGSYINGILVNIHANTHMLTREEYEADIAAGRENWVSIVQNPDTASFDFNFDIPYGEKGDDAEVTSVSYRYAQTQSGTTVPSVSVWSPDRPDPVAGRYMWTKMIITFNNDTAASREFITVVRNGTNGGGSASVDKPLTDSGTGVVGTNTTFARADHRHPLNIDDSVTPSVIGTTSSGGQSAKYSRADHAHKSQNISKSYTFSSGSSTWQATSYDSQGHGLPPYRATVSDTSTGIGGNDFFVATGFVYFVSPEYSSRKAYAENGIAAADVTEKGKMYFYADTIPTEAITVHIMKMVSA